MLTVLGLVAFVAFIEATGRGLKKEFMMARLHTEYGGGIDLSVGGKTFKLIKTDNGAFVDVPGEPEFVEPLLAQGFTRVDGTDRPGYVEQEAQRALTRNKIENRPVPNLSGGASTGTTQGTR